MKDLRVEEKQYIINYVALLEAIEEGIDGMVRCYIDRNYGLGDEYFRSLFTAFVELEKANNQLQLIFNDNELIRKLIVKSEKYLYLVQELSGTDENRAELVIKSLGPQFVQWKRAISSALNIYE